MCAVSDEEEPRGFHCFFPPVLLAFPVTMGCTRNASSCYWLVRIKIIQLVVYIHNMIQHSSFVGRELYSFVDGLGFFSSQSHRHFPLEMLFSYTCVQQGTTVDTCDGGYGPKVKLQHSSNQRNLSY